MFILEKITHDCPVCLTTNKAIVHWRYDCRLFKCTRCALLYSDLSPSEQLLNDFYEQEFTFCDIDLVGKACLEKWIDGQRRFYQDHYPHILNSLPSSAKVLDYGGGNMITATAFATMGYDSSCFEPFAKPKNIKALEQIDRPLPTLITDKAALPNNHFDLLISDNVIEHLPDIRQAIDDIVSLLKPGGRAIVITPQAASWDLFFVPTWMVYFHNAYRYRKQAGAVEALINAIQCILHRTWCLDPPRHLYAFSKKSMDIVLQDVAVRYRIRDMDINQFIQYKGTQNAIEEKKSIRFSVQSLTNKIVHKCKEQKLIKTLIKVFLRRFLRLLTPLAKALLNRTGRWGNVLIIELEKP